MMRSWEFESGGSVLVVNEREDGSAVLTKKDGPIESLSNSIAKDADVLLGKSSTEPVEPMKITKLATPYQSFPTDESDWDESAERTKATLEDLLFMAAWRDEGRPEQDSAYLLLHHRAGTHYVSFAALQQAMTTLMAGEAEIPQPDKRGAWDHLARHYREDFAKEPPEYTEAVIKSVDAGESVSSVVNFVHLKINI